MRLSELRVSWRKKNRFFSSHISPSVPTVFPVAGCSAGSPRSLRCLPLLLPCLFEAVWPCARGEEAGRAPMSSSELPARCAPGAAELRTTFPSLPPRPLALGESSRFPGAATAAARESLWRCAGAGEGERLVVACARVWET